MINLFNIANHKIDTNSFSNLLHDRVVEDFEKTIANYVGAKYVCSINSATNAIFLSMLNKNVTVDLPSMIPPVVANAIITSGNKINFVDNVEWVGDSYVLYQFDDYKIVDSAQKLEENQFEKECNSEDLMFFSFYPTKPLGGSDGGVIVTDDYEKYRWFKSAVLNGMSFANNNWERKISFPGYKMYMNSIQCYVAHKNLLRLEEKQKRFDEIRNFYNSEFDMNRNSKHLYRVNVKDNESFIEHAKTKGIQCGIHYRALHLNEIYKGENMPLPKSEYEHRTTISLPFHENLTDEEVEYIVKEIKPHVIAPHPR